jgi:hypothetical protein
MASQQETRALMLDAVGEVTEIESAQIQYRVGFRNAKGEGGVHWPAGNTLDGAKQQLAERQAAEAGSPNGIAYWYVEEQRSIQRTCVVLAVEP